MLFDLPESLIEKARKILRESEEAQKKPPETAPPEDENKDKEEPKQKGEKVVFNPEIKPDVYTEPYKVQPTT